jgi:hypothetical protein
MYKAESIAERVRIANCAILRGKTAVASFNWLCVNKDDPRKENFMQTSGISVFV